MTDTGKVVAVEVTLQVEDPGPITGKTSGLIERTIVPINGRVTISYGKSGATCRAKGIVVGGKRYAEVGCTEDGFVIGPVTDKWVQDLIDAHRPAEFRDPGGEVL